MRIREVIETINQMQADGVIDRYAVGGAVGAMFYLEPFSTLDVDIFMELHASQGALVVDPSPIFQYLKDRGCVMEGQYVYIADSPVQFIPPGNALAEEALNQAVDKDIQGTPARVFTAEHLAALALQVGRIKDKLRVAQFIQAGKLDNERFQAIVERHQLRGQWREFQKQFLKD
jgi:hypothetical protein